VKLNVAEAKAVVALPKATIPLTVRATVLVEAPGKNLRLEAATTVDVSVLDLPLFEAARFLNEVHTESIVVPIEKMNAQVSLNLKGKPFIDVLNHLGLTTNKRIERGKRRTGLLMLLLGFVIGALIFGLFF
jgi:hypothetical protein